MDTKNKTIRLPELLQLRCEQVLDELVSGLVDVNAVVVATSDGFEVTARAREGVDVAKLAAMACSISALGAMAGVESGIGQYQDVIIEADQGCIVIVEIPHPALPMILSVVVGKKEILGQVVYQAKRTVSKLLTPSLTE